MRNRALVSAIAIVWTALSSRAAIAIPAQEPLFLVSQVSPMVMFAMSVDHQLFMKAFADYSDLNGDGVIDNTYTDSFDYYGYFDSNRCYGYNSGGDYFEPRDAAGGTFSHHCNNSSSDGDWSGNFLNWATMTRIDVLRKALYGGKRIIDTASQTVLERELLPHDVHSFVKVYTPASGDSIANYMPSSFTSATTVSLCNSTPPPISGADQTENMSTATNHPKVRIANGDWGRWAADEVYQCEWRNNGVSPGTSQNLFGSGSSAPSVRVETCVTGRLEANCKTYDPTTAAKPTGLLQEYGEDGTLRFGLTSGSYQKRDKGGVLRKGISYLAGNVSPSDDEVNLADGTFNTGVNGIISTLDKIRLNTWDYSNRKYNDCNTFGISINTYLTSTSSNRLCSNWGNPVSELYLEAVRYMIGESGPTSTFNVTSDSLGLPTENWTSSSDPMAPDEWCTPMNVVLISSGDNDFDTDHLGSVPSVLGNIDSATDAIGSAEGLGGSVFIGEVGSTPSANPDSNVCSAKTFTSLSQMRGLCPATPQKQGGYAVAGIAYKAHTTDLRSDRQNDPITGDGQTINTYAIAMAKSLPDFVFDIGGRKVTVVPNGYASFDSGSTWRASSLAHLNVENAEYDINGKLVYARFLAHWEDSAWGNDYDMDVISRISVCVGAACTTHDDDGNGSNDSNPGSGQVRVTVRSMHKFSGAWMRVGFVISGTTADGVYPGVQQGSTGYTSFDNDPLRDANEQSPAVHVFTPGTSSGVPLPTPLQFAAKYGAFKDSNGNNLPDLQTEWDDDNDGIADSFFFADDPSQIGPKLASFLATIATTSSSASVVANSVSLQTSTRIYQARFDSADWSGSVVSFPVDLNNGQLLAAEWEAADRIKLQNWDTVREWMTWDSTNSVGVPFRWSDLNAAQQALLNINPGSNNPDGQGSNRLEYLRGNTSLELRNGTGTFRDRSTPLGDVVNSTPTVVGAPNFAYRDFIPGTTTLFESARYSAFKAQYANVDCASLTPRDREPILYFGANDGALHGVSACTGDEWLAYVPNSVFSTLNKLTSTNYAHQYYVDGPSTVVDAFWTGAWHTALVGTLRAGGKGVFALDVTDPTRFDEAYANQVVLWDIDNTTTGFSELGYTYSQPAVIKAEGHGWVAVFGNGYHGASGKAVMYVVRINDGTLLASIDLSATGPGSTSHGSNNGLSTLSPIDTDGDGDVDLIYGGDLNGNVWRFAAVSGTGFTRATTTLLYTARNAGGTRQKITSRLAVGYHPTSAVGRMVYLGTGKYYETVDQDPANSVQDNTMYGIWDRDNGLTVGTVTTRDSNILQKQTISTQTVSTFGANTETIRIVSNSTVNWAPATGTTCTATASCGWYLDLTDTGEKMVATPILRGGRLIFVTTTPSPIPCEEGGSGWLMELDARTGGRLDTPVFDLNGDGVFNLSDSYSTTVGSTTTYTPPSGKKSKVGILQPPAILSGIGGAGGGSSTGAEGKYSSGSKNAAIDVTIESSSGITQGRKSWVRVK